jgi:hypothetical protein
MKKMDINSTKFTDAQLKLHGITKENGVLNYKDSSSNSLFNPIDETNCYYDIIPNVMETSSDTAKIKIPQNGQYIDIDVPRLISKANSSYSNLAGVHMSIKIPQIEVLEEYKHEVEICLTQNPVDNIWIKIDQLWGAKIRDTLDNRIQDSCESYQAKNSNDKYNFAGNNELIEWNTIIKEQEPESTILWDFYIGGTNNSLPLFLIPEGVYFNIYLRNKYSDIIRMRIKTKDGNWIYLSKPELKYLGIFDERAMISDIKIIGSYFDRLPSEIDEIFNNAISCNTEVNGKADKVTKPIMTYKTYNFAGDKGLDEIKPKGYGETVKFKPPVTSAAKVIIVSAENIDSSNRNLRSNYTTNPININLGKSPIGDIIVKNGQTKEEIIFTPNDRRRFMQMFLPKMPRFKGHEFLFNSINPTDSSDCNGKSLASNDIKIIVKLVSPPDNPFTDCKFRVSLRIQVVRTVKFFFDGDPKDKNARKNIRWEIE